MSAHDQEILAQLVDFEKFCESTGWDQPHMIVVYYRIRGAALGVSITPMLSYPPGLLPTIVQAAVHVYRKDNRKARPVAVAFQTEGWGVDLSGPLADAKARLASYPYEHYEDDPNRIEIRTIAALDVNGWLYLVSRRRGEELPLVSTQPDSEARAQELRVGSPPRYHEALRTTMEVLARRA